MRQRTRDAEPQAVAAINVEIRWQAAAVVSHGDFDHRILASPQADLDPARIAITKAMFERVRDCLRDNQRQWHCGIGLNRDITVGVNDALDVRLARRIDQIRAQPLEKAAHVEPLARWIMQLAVDAADHGQPPRRLVQRGARARIGDAALLRSPPGAMAKL